jgi:hypothetical protein
MQQLEMKLLCSKKEVISSLNLLKPTAYVMHQQV